MWSSQRAPSGISISLVFSFLLLVSTNATARAGEQSFLQLAAEKGGSDPFFSTPEPSKPRDKGKKAASLRAMEVEATARLLLEGEVLYASDARKKSGYDYCLSCVNLANGGRFRSALREASKALFLGERQGDDFLLAHAERDLAYVYSLVGLLDRAAISALNSITYVKRAANVDRSKILGPSYKVLGDVDLRKGAIDRALENYELALRHTKDQAFAWYLRVSLANAYLKGEQFQKAEALFEAARRESGSSSKNAALAVRGLGNLALARGDLERAVALFLETIAALERKEDSYELIWSHAGLARARRGKGDLEGAISAYAEAIEVAGKVRTLFRSDEFKSALFADLQEVFEGAIAVNLEAGHTAEAFAISETSRSRALLDMVDARVEASLGAQAFSRVTDRPVSLAELQTVIPDNTVLLEYHLLPESLVVWQIRATGTTTSLITEPRGEIERELSELRWKIFEGSAAVNGYLERLHARLFAPLEIGAGENIVVVPHGPLHYLPFHALRAGGVYLIESHGLSYAPSGAAYHAIMARSASRPRSLSAFGNPALGSEQLSLPGAEREVQQIGRYFAETAVFLGPEATKEKFLEVAPGSNALHLATHATVDEISPLHSEILLAGPGEGPDVLEAHEVYRLDLSQTDIITLSACDTGRGVVGKGDEIMGFTRTFLGAGASALLVSLWRVNDASTALLMDSVYRLRTEDGLSLREALQRAQIELLTSQEWAHPAFWAPFILIGDWR